MSSHDALLILPNKGGADTNRFGTTQEPGCTVKDKPLNFKGVYGNN